jgi:5-methylcytosine-specific restriction endonuclease McrA
MTLPGMIHADHIIEAKDLPHPNDFWDINNIQILCKPHHFAKSFGGSAERGDPTSPNA